MAKGSTYPLKTPRTKLSMKKEPITMRGIKNTQLKALPRASFVCNKDIILIWFLLLLKFVYPIHDRSPPLHCDTLKCCEHGQANVVK